MSLQALDAWADDMDVEFLVDMAVVAETAAAVDATWFLIRFSDADPTVTSQEPLARSHVE